MALQVESSPGFVPVEDACLRKHLLPCPLRFLSRFMPVAQRRALVLRENPHREHVTLGALYLDFLQKQQT